MSAPVIDRPKTQGGDSGSETFNWAQYEGEFEKTCQAYSDPDPACPNKATWIASSSHGAFECPSPEVYLCEQHMKEALEWMIKVLKMKPPAACKRCNILITGQVSDFLKAIKL